MFEPLSAHLREYEWALAQYLGAGVAACYRGYRFIYRTFRCFGKRCIRKTPVLSPYLFLNCSFYLLLHGRRRYRACVGYLLMYDVVVVLVQVVRQCRDEGGCAEVGEVLQAIPGHSHQRHRACATSRHAVHRQLHARQPLPARACTGHGLQSHVTAHFHKPALAALLHGPDGASACCGTRRQQHHLPACSRLLYRRAD